MTNFQNQISVQQTGGVWRWSLDLVEVKVTSKYRDFQSMNLTVPQVWSQKSSLYKIKEIYIAYNWTSAACKFAYYPKYTLCKIRIISVSQIKMKTVKKKKNNGVNHYFSHVFQLKYNHIVYILISKTTLFSGNISWIKFIFPDLNKLLTKCMLKYNTA